MLTVLVKNGILADSGALRALDVLIAGGKVERLCPRGETIQADAVVDAAGLYVLPGLIDAHNHPVYADRIGPLSRAALAGGITTVIPYIGSVAAWGQQGGLVQSIAEFIREGEATACVDFSVHCTFTRNVMDEADAAIPALFDMGVCSFKAFTSYRKRGMKLEDEEILHLMELVAARGGLLAFHAENGALLDYLEDKALAEGRTHPRCYPATHPPLSEAEAVFRVLTLAASTRCGIYLPHLTCEESLAVADLFRSWNVLPALYTETCPHYLALTDDELERRGNLAKMSPPLRKEKDRLALWKAVADRRIDVVASDAAGHAVAANEPLFEETFRAPHGTPGVETLFGVTWDEGINGGRIGVTDFVRIMSENPAKIFGLYPRKGTLRPGSDADMVLVDPGLPLAVPERNPHLTVDYSLFAGRQCLGGPVTVLRRGEIVCERGKITGAQPGRFLPASPILTD